MLPAQNCTSSSGDVGAMSATTDVFLVFINTSYCWCIFKGEKERKEGRKEWKRKRLGGV